MEFAGLTFFLAATDGNYAVLGVRARRSNGIQSRCRLPFRSRQSPHSRATLAGRAAESFDRGGIYGLLLARIRGNNGALSSESMALDSLNSRAVVLARLFAGEAFHRLVPLLAVCGIDVVTYGGNGEQMTEQCHFHGRCNSPT